MATQPRKRKRVAAPRSAHHFVWHSCLCVEAGSLLKDGDRGTWCKDADAVLAFKRKVLKHCAGIVESDAAAIRGFAETLTFYAPYVFGFVHLAFPARRFPTTKAAKDFLADAFKMDEGSDVLRPYLKESWERVFDIRKNKATRETDVFTKDEHGEDAFQAMLDWYFQ